MHDTKRLHTRIAQQEIILGGFQRLCGRRVEQHEQRLRRPGGLGLTLKGNEFGNTLRGSLGNDQLYGGGGNDTFLFASTADSTGASMDTIFDFNTGDKIDVRTIDADGNGGNGDTAFILDALGNNSFALGHIRQTVSGTTLKLEFNTDADTAAEMTILLQNHGAGLGAGEVLL